MPGHQLLVLTVLGHICQPSAGHRHHRSAVVLGVYGFVLSAPNQTQSLFTSTRHQFMITWC